MALLLVNMCMYTHTHARFKVSYYFVSSLENSGSVIMMT